MVLPFLSHSSGTLYLPLYSLSAKILAAEQLIPRRAGILVVALRELPVLAALLVAFRVRLYD